MEGGETELEISLISASFSGISSHAALNVGLHLPPMNEIIKKILSPSRHAGSKIDLKQTLTDISISVRVLKIQPQLYFMCSPALDTFQKRTRVFCARKHTGVHIIKHKAESKYDSHRAFTLLHNLSTHQ